VVWWGKPPGHEGGLTKKDMSSKTKFSTPIDRMKEDFSGWSGVVCETCGRETTKAQLSYRYEVLQNVVVL
jgi:hypothetical protein